MSIYAIGDLHLSNFSNKTMDMFGEHWHNHWLKIQESWKKKVSNEDLVLVPGDISWAMTVNEAVMDLEEIGALPGEKIILKGNHDYWWKSLSKIKEASHKSIFYLQNNSYEYGDYVICGSRGWNVPGSKEFGAKDKTIYEREIIRLRLSLDSVKSDKEKLVIMHYPPYNDKCEFNGFIDVLLEYDIKEVIFGHIHGKGLWNLKEGNIFGINFTCVSCDYLNFDLKKIH